MKKMKIIYLYLILLLSFADVYAQGVYNNGAKIVIGAGVFVNINGTGGNYLNDTNGTDGSVDLTGTLAIAGNVTNNAVADVLNPAATGGTLILSGTTSQTIGGTTASYFTFPHLKVNNPAGIVISKDAQINDILTLTSGLVDIGNNNFTFGPSAVVAGSPSETSMIIATGTSQVRKNWSVAGTFTFPVGDKTATAEYSPVTLNFTAGTFGAGAATSLNLVNSKYNDPLITGSYLNRCWNIAQTGITGFSCDALFQYVAADVNGSEDSITSLKFSPAMALNPVNASLHQFSETALNSFGTFTGGPGFRKLNLRLFLEGLYAGNGMMNMSQGNSGNQYTGTVADKITVELHDPITYSNLVASFPNVDLNTDGTAALKIPVSMNGSYYLTIKNRNSLETTSATALLMSPQTLNYDYTLSETKAYGSNQKKMIQGVVSLFSGDVNQDGIVDTGDMNVIDNASTVVLMGYNAADVNGDGIVDTSDMNIVDNNSTAIITIQLP